MINSIFQLKTYRIVFHFYKGFLWLCLLITLFSFYFKLPLTFILFIKLLFFTILFFVHLEVKLSQQLTFYQNFSISRTKLFFVSFLIDIPITIVLFLILETF